MATPDSFIPADDAQRLQALQPYLLLGPAPDAVFDEVVRLTAKLFNAPIALVSLVEKESVFFKANFGLAGAERTARNESLCSVAILQDETTVYADLLQEPCKLTDPTVANALQLRFYAGHPLRTTTGEKIGALCIIDHQPRRLTSAEEERLQQLAEAVMKLLNLRVALQQRPELGSTLWLQLYTQLDASLTRLGTLTELARWEESPHTPGALHYQNAIGEETDLVIRLLDTQVNLALASLQEP